MGKTEEKEISYKLIEQKKSMIQVSVPENQQSYFGCAEGTIKICADIIGPFDEDWL